MNYVSIYSILLKANILIKIIILILISFSIISWTIIIQKIWILNIAANEIKVFGSIFWSSNITLFKIYQGIQTNSNKLTGITQIFYSGFKEFILLNQKNNNVPEVVIKGTCRVMRIAMNHELKTLETYIPFLGTLAFISPYIGLLGTVLGIMHTFVTLGTMKQINLQMVAPGIAEALIATAIALLVAIPAVIAFNYLNQRINKIEFSYANFAEELTAILYRQIFTNINNNKK